ncbi:Sec-independent protein translocase protein TatB [Blastomonas fulva]|uniref:Sec-independent protein translocase protein TatB n=1 Tax=Blastomonas fulva TaxID=1550728 RepID=UPI0025A4A518|nr:Sec-independent protein translocase protein TatB [Blastomonas fulva]MDM7927376.1 Sec-independent protein translocase protein TatB [Blastomonas fulva]MDM7964816.1 Sec-independent protein translocase protein TatB [Blastomonas fulva]
MLDIGSTELLMIIIVAIVVIGPKDLPRALYKVGQVIGKAKGVARHFRTGIDAMVREVELEEMEKKWKADNERIMREHAAPQPASATPAADPAAVMQPLAATQVPEVTAASDAPVASADVPATAQGMPVTEGER